MKEHLLNLKGLLGVCFDNEKKKKNDVLRSHLSKILSQTHWAHTGVFGKGGGGPRGSAVPVEFFP